MNEYPAKLVRVIDGDTVVLDVDLGFHVTIRETFRLYGVNCPEMKGETREAGMKARGFVVSWFEKHPEFTVTTFKPRQQDKYGRWLACVWQLAAGAETLNGELVLSENAVRADYT